MNSDPVDLLPPRLLIVDDERQIHASLRLRLGGAYELEFAFDAGAALDTISRQRFDLCLADIHMPKVDGLAFIDAAQKIDPGLGFVVLSAFDSHENLRRAIPLQVYDFISKPLPERADFESRLPEWIERTRQRRRDQGLARQAGEIAADREAALLEREVELVASETARDALRQTAGLQTTIQAHLQSATTQLAVRARTDPSLLPLLRSLEEARKTGEAAMTASGSFFDSAYGDRDHSPALPNDGIRHAIDIATRMGRTAEGNKTFDFRPIEPGLPVRGLSGIGFLLMIVPILGAAAACAAPNTTVGVRSEQVPRLEVIPRDSAHRGYYWLNRKRCLGSHAAVLITVSASAAPLTQGAIEAWLANTYAPLETVTSRGLVRGIQKCQGLLGAAVPPHRDRFELALLLPT